MESNNRKRSSIWRYFTELNPKQAKCDLCSSVYSFHSTTTNLFRHLSRKHITVEIENQSASSSSQIEAVELKQDIDSGISDCKIEVIMESNRRKTSSVWRYFTEITPDQAKCNFCSKIYSFKAGTTSNLSRHLKAKHQNVEVEIQSVPCNSQTETVELKQNNESDATEPCIMELNQNINNSISECTVEVIMESNKKRSSSVWRHFTEINREHAECNYCSKVFSFKAGTSNLFRHLKIRHPDIEIESPPRSSSQSITVPLNQNNENDAVEPYLIELKQNNEISKCEVGVTMQSSNRKRSHIWRYFTEINPDQAKCGLCSKVYSYTGNARSNLSRHLKKKHPNIDVENQSASSSSQIETVVLNQNMDNDVSKPSTSNQNMDNDVSKPSTSTRNTNEITERRESSSELNKLLVQPQIKQFVHKPLTLPTSTNKALDELLLKLIVKQYHPFHLVEQPEFRNFVQQLNPEYVIPSRKTVSNVLLEETYNKTAEKVRNSLDSADTCSITITSISNNNFIAVTAHYIDNECKLYSAFLDCFNYNVRHTSEDVATKIKRVCEKWNIMNKVVALVSDNVPNMINAGTILGWPHMPCFVHTLNLIVQNAITEIKPLQMKAKAVVEFFKRNSQALTKLKSVQHQMGYPKRMLKQEIPRRWNSTLLMFESIVTNEEPISSTLTLLNPEILLNQEEFGTLKKICEILKPFLEVTEEVSSEKEVTISKIILFRRGLVTFISKYKEDEQHEEIKKVIRRIKEELQQRFGDLEERSILAEATVLDPRFKKPGFESNEAYDKAKHSICQESASALIATTEETAISEEEVPRNKPQQASSVWRDFDSSVEKLDTHIMTPLAASVIEFDIYIQEPLLPRKSDPFKWWKQRQICYPRLFHIMKKRLCIVGTSVPCERVFSKEGNILTKRRAGVSSTKLSQILFLNYHL